MKCAQESQRKGQKEDEQEVSGWMRKKIKKKRKKKKKVSGLGKAASRKYIKPSLKLLYNIFIIKHIKI